MVTVYRFQIISYRLPIPYKKPIIICAPWNQQISTLDMWRNTSFTNFVKWARLHLTPNLTSTKAEDFRRLYVFSLLFCSSVQKLKTASCLPVLVFISIKHVSMTLFLRDFGMSRWCPHYSTVLLNNMPLYKLRSMGHQWYEQSTVFICSGPRSCGVFKFLWAGVEPKAIILLNSFFPRQNENLETVGLAHWYRAFNFHQMPWR